MTRRSIIPCRLVHVHVHVHVCGLVVVLYMTLKWFVCLQVTEQTGAILRDAGFELEERGKVFVKGKGEMTTFYVVGTDKGRIIKDQQ